MYLWQFDLQSQKETYQILVYAACLPQRERRTKDRERTKKEIEPRSFVCDLADAEICCKVNEHLEQPKKRGCTCAYDKFRNINPRVRLVSRLLLPIFRETSVLHCVEIDLLEMSSFIALSPSW
jgi:hypothetical protein